MHLPQFSFLACSCQLNSCPSSLTIYCYTERGWIPKALWWWLHQHFAFLHIRCSLQVPINHIQANSYPAKVWGFFRLTQPLAFHPKLPSGNCFTFMCLDHLYREWISGQMTQWNALSHIVFGVNFFHLCWSFAQSLNYFFSVSCFCLSSAMIWLWTYLKIAKLNSTLMTGGLVLYHFFHAKETALGVARQRRRKTQEENWKEICSEEDATSADEKTKRTGQWSNNVVVDDRKHRTGPPNNKHVLL